MVPQELTHEKPIQRMDFRGLTTAPFFQVHRPKEGEFFELPKRAEARPPAGRETMTARPGLTAYEADGVTTITIIEWGDVQQSEFQTHQVVLKNTGGNQILYILENPTRQNSEGNLGSL